MERQSLEAIPTIINDENVLNEANRSTVDSNRSQSVSSCLFIAIKLRAVDSRRNQEGQHVKFCQNTSRGNVQI